MQSKQTISCIESASLFLNYNLPNRLVASKPCQKYLIYYKNHSQKFANNISRF